MCIPLNLIGTVHLKMPAAAMLPPIPTHYTLGTTVPLFESNQIEFKQTTISFEKLKKTVCAFLNSIGGYIFIGIDDQRIVQGIPYALADRLTLFVDNLISGRSIIRRDGSADLTIREIQTRTMPVGGSDGSLFLLIITVQPNSMESDYMWTTGERYFRLNASNYCRRDDPTEIMQLKEKISGLKKECGTLGSQLSAMTHALRKSMAAESKAAINRDLALDLLHHKILVEKRAAEKKLMPTPCDLLGLLCALVR